MIDPFKTTGITGAQYFDTDNIDEIERLRLLLKHEKMLNKAWFNLHKINDELREENDKLRELIKCYTQDHVRLLNELLRDSAARKALGETDG